MIIILGLAGIWVYSTIMALSGLGAALWYVAFMSGCLWFCWGDNAIAWLIGAQLVCWGPLVLLATTAQWLEGKRPRKTSQP